MTRKEHFTSFMTTGNMNNSRQIVIRITQPTPKRDKESVIKMSIKSASSVFARARSAERRSLQLWAKYSSPSKCPFKQDAQWSRKPKNVQKFRITLFWHVVGLRDVNFTKM